MLARFHITKRRVVIAAIVVAASGGTYMWYRAAHPGDPAPRYLTAAVVKGTITVGVSGTGQASVSNQVDVKAKAAGDVTKVTVSNGQTVNAGSVLAQLDTSAIQKTVRDAQANLDSAKLSLEKLLQPADQLSILQAENSLTQAIEAKQVAADNLAKSYEAGFNTVANVFLDLPSIISELHDILYSSTLSQNQTNLSYYYDVAKEFSSKSLEYRDDADATYQAARVAYDKNFQDYKVVTRASSSATIESTISETYATVLSVSTAVKSANDFIQFYEDVLVARNLKPASLANTHLALLSSQTGKVTSSLSSLLSAKTALPAGRDVITSAERTIAERTASLAKLRSGADPLDVKSQELALQQRRNALLDAQEKLADATVRAPFTGIIANVAVKTGDSVSAGTTVVTLITTEHLAEVTLNEVDVAKVELGQKAVLTFDAVEGLSISGAVVDIASLGTVSQGVVSYAVKVGFDTQDDRIKAGMSVSVSIITEVKQDVLLVPSSAVKSQAQSGSYVEVLENGLPQRRQVQVGLSNDTETEVSGSIIEGEQVVTQTITAAPSAQSGQTQRTGGGVLPLGGGGAFRVLGGGR